MGCRLSLCNCSANAAADVDENLPSPSSCEHNSSAKR